MRNSDAAAPAELPVDPARTGDRARRDPFGIGTPRQPGWDVLGVVQGGLGAPVQDGPDGTTGAAATEVVEVRRNGLVSGVVGSLAAALAVAWLSRAAAGGTWFDWTVTAVLGVVAVLHLSAFVDGRVPLAVIDEHGVRMRFGRTWQGLPWPSIDHVVHQPRSGLLRDGHLVVEPFEADEVVAALDGRARRQAWVTRRLHGGAFAIPLGLSTRLVGTSDLTDSLLRLADDDVEVVVPEPVVEPAVEPAAEVSEDLAVDGQPAPYERSDADVELAPYERSDADAEPAPYERSDAHDDAADAAHPHPAADYTVARDLPVLTSVGRWVEDDDTDDTDGAVEHETHDRHDDGHDAEPETPDGDRPEVRRVAPWMAGVIARVAEYRRRGREQADGTVVAWSEERTDLPHADTETETDTHTSYDEDRPAPVEASATPLPLRDLRPASRSEHEAEERLPEAAELRRSGEPALPTYSFAEPEPVAAESTVEPVIGPELTAARGRLGLSVDQVAERTRIRPHVIEAIEVDDFGPCGGDFYARGHLRTLARVLGIDATDLLAAYDERYADAPIDARRVFEAELAGATGGGLRATRGGPNWSVLVAAVMSLVLLWSVAQLLFEGDREVETTSGSAGLSSGTAAAAVGLELQAGEVDASVTVRDGDGVVVWQGDLAAGDTHSVEAVPPLRISSTDGSVTARVSGGDAAALGEAGTAVQRTLVP